MPLIGKYSKDVIGNMCKAAKWSIAVDVFLAGKVASVQKGFDFYKFLSFDDNFVGYLIEKFSSVGC